ncbi:bifunctional DNA primase/polymerase [Streptomyces sp. NPDC004732]|uniref:bifunctional DNA primase/polymerase n=1 Tax=Streptomyces sp. NPDC004732 TaxID=3154290 RepID=UPI0033ADCC3F
MSKAIAPLDAALSYAAFGWRVMGALPGYKRPTLRGWPEFATTDRDTIISWGWPDDANVCIVTGQASNLWVLDVDDKDGANGSATLAALERQYGELPATRAVATGSGGIHYYWTWEGVSFPLGNSAGKLGPGLDTRGNGGQVVAPPSVSESGPYTVVQYEAVAAAPTWLLGLLAAQRDATQGEPGAFAQPGMTGSPAKRFRGLVKAVLRAEQGNRNHCLLWAACSSAEMVGAGEITAEQAAEALTQAAANVGLGYAEATATIRSGFRMKGVR